MDTVYYDQFLENLIAIARISTAIGYADNPTVKGRIFAGIQACEEKSVEDIAELVLETQETCDPVDDPYCGTISEIYASIVALLVATGRLPKIYDIPLRALRAAAMADLCVLRN